jgi:hypothetical protein
MPVEGSEECEKEQADGENEVERETDMRYEGDNLPIGEVGDGEPSDKANDRDNEEGAHIAGNDDAPLNTGEGTRGEDHHRNGHHRENLTQSVKTIRKDVGPDERNSGKKKIEYGEMKKTVGPKVGELTTEATLEKPVDKE